MKSATLLALLIFVVARQASAATDPATTFVRKCSSCHTFGHGVRVGPDLKGATDRHSRKWLMAWIASSDSVIRSRDPAAVALFKKFNEQRMPDQSLNQDELSALLDYLTAGGPAFDARNNERRADTATPAEIELGRMLFVGRRLFARGGASCLSCHGVARTGSGGTLGPDLSRAYARFHDKGLTALLARGCFPRVPHRSDQAALTEQESFALRAFLRHAMDVTP